MIICQLHENYQKRNELVGKSNKNNKSQMLWCKSTETDARDFRHKFDTKLSNASTIQDDFHRNYGANLSHAPNPGNVKSARTPGWEFALNNGDEEEREVVHWLSTLNSY